MDRAFVVQRVELAQRHVADGKKIVARQREIVAKLGADGHNVTEARKLLTAFEDSQRLHVADCARLEMQLAETAGPRAAETDPEWFPGSS